MDRGGHCFYCGSKNISEEIQESSWSKEDTSTAYLCNNCKRWFVIRSGSSVEEWIEDSKEDD